MTFASSLARYFELPTHQRGQMLAVLALLSIIISLASAGLSAVRLGFTSLFLIPSAFLMTTIHHLAIWYNLRSGNLQVSAQIHTTSTPPCLKHAGNISVLLIVSSLWVAGGVLTVVFILVGAPYGARTMSSVPDWTSSCLAFIEAIVLSIMAMICWKALARKEYYSMSTH